MTKKFYVTMTDKFMSGWGMSENKTNKLVIECESYEEAEIVYNNALNRSEMKYVNICDKKPYYNSNRYFVSWKTKEEYNTWFIPNSFKS
jgi:tRNA uridine 5-carbamoylmethylation protein Kti12